MRERAGCRRLLISNRGGTLTIEKNLGGMISTPPSGSIVNKQFQIFGLAMRTHRTRACGPARPKAPKKRKTPLPLNHRAHVGKRV